MARIEPVRAGDAGQEGHVALEAIAVSYGLATNMKATLARSPVALRSLMTWYDLRD